MLQWFIVTIFFFFLKTGIYYVVVSALELIR